LSDLCCGWSYRRELRQGGLGDASLRVLRLVGLASAVLQVGSVSAAIGQVGGDSFF
jgi:hypothetical protein